MSFICLSHFTATGHYIGPTEIALAYYHSRHNLAFYGNSVGISCNHMATKGKFLMIFRVVLRPCIHALNDINKTYDCKVLNVHGGKYIDLLKYIIIMNK